MVHPRSEIQTKRPSQDIIIDFLPGHHYRTD